jgi:protoporphyrinogen/coproporphyrinogen III oxidase
MQLQKHVVILGGGIGGLVAAWMLRHPSIQRLASDKQLGKNDGAFLLPPKVTIIESNDRFGGWLQTTRTGPRKLLFELGCRGIRPVGSSGKDALHLIELLGLQHSTLTASKSSSKRFIQVGDSLLSLPRSLFEVVTSPLMRNLPFWILNDLLTKSRNRDTMFDESLADFATRRFGDKEGVANTLLDAAMSGIYAGDVSKLSAASTAKFLWEVEGTGGLSPLTGSVIAGILSKSMIPSLGTTINNNTNNNASEELSFFIEEASKASSVSFVDGMQMLPDELINRLRKDDGVSLLSLTDVIKIEPGNEGKTVNVFLKPTIHSPTGNTSKIISADSVISALPASSLLKILPTSLTDTVTRLHQIEFANVAVVGLGWRRRNVIPTEFVGFGFLTPTKERLLSHNILGAVFDSIAFPGQSDSFAARRREWRVQPESSVSPCTEKLSPKTNSLQETRISVMMGGSHWPEVINTEESKLADIAVTAAKSLLGVSSKPSDIIINVGKACIPQYNVDHKERVNLIERDIEKVFNKKVSIIGNSFHGVGVADTISKAMQTGKKVFASF